MPVTKRSGQGCRGTHTVCPSGLAVASGFLYGCLPGLSRPGRTHPVVLGSGSGVGVAVGSGPAGVVLAGSVGGSDSGGGTAAGSGVPDGTAAGTASAAVEAAGDGLDAAAWVIGWVAVSAAERAVEGARAAGDILAAGATSARDAAAGWSTGTGTAPVVPGGPAVVVPVMSTGVGPPVTSPPGGGPGDVRTGGSDPTLGTPTPAGGPVVAPTTYSTATVASARHTPIVHHRMR
jgi:hypothetical protein